MKYLHLICCLFITSFCFSQINPGNSSYQQTDSCNFSSTWSRLNIDTNNPNNDWVIGSTNKSFFGQANSLPNAIMTDTANAYSPSNLSFFEIGFSTWDGSGFGYNMYLTFDHKYETDTLIDGGYITVSHDSGQTWQNIIFDSTCIMCFPNINTQNLYNTSDTLINGEFGFSGTSDWKTTTVQWIWAVLVRTETQQRSDSMIVRFNFISDSNQTFKDGWIIDNFEIGMIDLGSSIEEFKNTLEVSLYPNVTSNFFNYKLEKGKLEQITIVNLLGENVYTKNSTESSGQVNISSLPIGNYFVKFCSAKGSVTKRLIIN